MGLLRRRGALRMAGLLVVVAAVASATSLAQSGGAPAAHGKTLQGTKRADVLVGTRHADVIKGLRGDDVITGRGGSDRLFGGRGGDRLRARDGHQDTIDCGPGRDVAIVDRAELGVYDCERVKFPKPGQKRGEG
jgi:Ca2+-binding RTX toxin-like protein